MRFSEVPVSGKSRARLDEATGVHDAAAWGLVVKGRKLDLPAAPIALPEAYTVELTFSSGDYGGRVKERILLKRSAGVASLERAYTTAINAAEKRERWSPFTVADADRTARAIAYVIDYPWLLIDEKAINQRFWEEQKKTRGKSQTVGPRRFGEMVVRALSSERELLDERWRRQHLVERRPMELGRRERRPLQLGGATGAQLGVSVFCFAVSGVEARRWEKSPQLGRG
ncbi:MAG: hypothetical protein ACI9UA_006164 [Pseudoalteromonas tetraodonis]|jgi:hypothetical protein